MGGGSLSSPVKGRGRAIARHRSGPGAGVSRASSEPPRRAAQRLFSAFAIYVVTFVGVVTAVTREVRLLGGRLSRQCREELRGCER